MRVACLLLACAACGGVHADLLLLPTATGAVGDSAPAIDAMSAGDADAGTDMVDARDDRPDVGTIEVPDANAGVGLDAERGNDADAGTDAGAVPDALPVAVDAVSTADARSDAPWLPLDACGPAACAPGMCGTIYDACGQTVTCPGCGPDAFCAHDPPTAAGRCLHVPDLGCATLTLQSPGIPPNFGAIMPIAPPLPCGGFDAYGWTLPASTACVEIRTSGPSGDEVQAYECPDAPTWSAVCSPPSPPESSAVWWCYQ